MRAHIDDKDVMDEVKWQEYRRQCEIEDKRDDLIFKITVIVCMAVCIVNLILHIYLIYLNIQ
jgi:hypothetical protein